MSLHHPCRIIGSSAPPLWGAGSGPNGPMARYRPRYNGTTGRPAPMRHSAILFTYRPFENTNKMPVRGTKSTWVVRKFFGWRRPKTEQLGSGNRFAFVTQGSPSTVLKASVNRRQSLINQIVYTFSGIHSLLSMTFVSVRGLFSFSCFVLFFQVRSKN